MRNLVNEFLLKIADVIDSKADEIAKEVGARPLTMDEVNIGDALFMEYKDESHVEPVLILEDGFSPNLMGYRRQGYEMRWNIHKKSYGKCWRLWKNKPSRRERKAVPWEGKHEDD